MSEESIKPPARSDNSLNPELDYIENPKLQVALDGSCLKQDKETFMKSTFILFMKSSYGHMILH